jgi:hypothetical protein
MRGILCSLLVLFPAIAFADGGRIEGTITDLNSHQAVPRITVLVEPPAAKPTISDDRGRFAFEVPPGAYQVVAVVGNGHVVTTVTVAAGETATARIRIDGTYAYERIDIHEQVSVPAEPIEKYEMKMPKYSDEAMQSDVWGLAWAWLYISATGEVVGMQFLKRPGYGLDDLAVERAFGMRFEPARDAQGHAIASQRLWKMEWPSYDWLTNDGVNFDTPSTGYRRLFWGKRSADRMACRGSGPVNPEWYPRYRDCTPPDLHALETAPLISRPHATSGLKFAPHARLDALPATARRQICEWAAELPSVDRGSEPVEACTERLATLSQPASEFVSCTLARAKGKACNSL